MSGLERDMANTRKALESEVHRRDEDLPPLVQNLLASQAPAPHADASAQSSHTCGEALSADGGAPRRGAEGGIARAQWPSSSKWHPTGSPGRRPSESFSAAPLLGLAGRATEEWPPPQQRGGSHRVPAELFGALAQTLHRLEGTAERTGQIELELAAEMDRCRATCAAVQEDFCIATKQVQSLVHRVEDVEQAMAGGGCGGADRAGQRTKAPPEKSQGANMGRQLWRPVPSSPVLSFRCAGSDSHTTTDSRSPRSIGLLERCKSAPQRRLAKTGATERWSLFRPSQDPHLGGGGGEAARL